MSRRIRIIALTGTVVLTAGLALAGCTSDTAGGTDAGSETAGSTLSIQFVNPLPNYPSWRAIGDCLAEEAKSQGVDFTESGPTGSAMDPTTMITQIQSAIANKKGAIMTLPASDAFGPILTQAQDAGIVTTTFYGDGADDSGADINVGVDWTELGKLYVEAIETIPGDKKVGLMTSADTGIGKSWMDGVKSAAEGLDDFEIVGEVYTGDDSSKALDQTNALLTAHPEVNVITTNLGTATAGTLSALEAKNLTGKVQFLGNGPDNGGKEALQAGTEYRILMQDLCGAAKKSLVATVEALKSGEAGGETLQIPMGFIMAGTDDYDDLVAKNWG
ncbi:sugar ABC transporter substrate-binding protein [Herbiconiux sp. CPCC 205716]|uniref:Sugar ABC transporter substrate-binding protein n=1 Tax=Herbiconiux gentiana TaxID=2970912 RepID=A0ABT2GHQ0_9MICO|nr:sugar ABC transporter substrate-binding protein [Herbiconiux gentiana]MCS5715750.1 sugar ABC transporter substrate-binding protein [Herbiconiux gentiana]